MTNQQKYHTHFDKMRKTLQTLYLVNDQRARRTVLNHFIEFFEFYVGQKLDCSDQPHNFKHIQNLQIFHIWTILIEQLERKVSKDIDNELRLEIIC